jgi:hypothetical protein
VVYRREPFCGVEIITKFSFVDSRNSCVPSYFWVFTKKDDIDFVAGSGKSILWYVHFLMYSFLALNDLQALQLSRTSTACARPDWPHWGSIFSTLAIQKRSTAAACSPPYSGSFVISRTSIMMPFQIFIRYTATENKAPVTVHL